MSTLLPLPSPHAKNVAGDSMSSLTLKMPESVQISPEQVGGSAGPARADGVGGCAAQRACLLCGYIGMRQGARAAGAGGARASGEDAAGRAPRGCDTVQRRDERVRQGWPLGGSRTGAHSVPPPDSASLTICLRPSLFSLFTPSLIASSVADHIFPLSMSSRS